MTGYTIYITYGLSDGNYGYSNAIHCNYINKLIINTAINSDINLHFNDASDFRFLADDLSVGGTGYTATKMYVLVQAIDNSLYTNVNDIKPASDQWRIYDVTSQINGYVLGSRISGINIASTTFQIALNTYNLASTYNLDYLNYPKQNVTGSTMTFGEETLFLGNVSTDIEAIAESMEIDILLPAGQYNTTSNKTWDGISKVYISEVGIYNANNELVAIGKLNTPVSKDSTIARTLVFGIDF